MNRNRSFSNLATYEGSVNTLKDAVLLIEAVRIGRLPTITRRLNGYEREHIRPNLIYVWNETECGLKRWTDGKVWSASKASGPFLVYSELNNKSNTEPKINGLVKQSFSLNTKQNHKYHLIAYTLKSNFSSLPPTQAATPGTGNSPSFHSLESNDLAQSSQNFSHNLPPHLSSVHTGTAESYAQSPSNDPLLNCLHLSPSIYQDNLLSYIYNGIPVMASLHSIDSPPVRRYNAQDQMLVQELNKHF